MRGYDYLSFVGQNVLFANAELRFPIIEAALTPIGVVGGVRGVFFANIGGAWWDNQGYKFANTQGQVVRPVVSYKLDALGNAVPMYGPQQVVTGFRLQDGRASYGLGLETFALGFPIHFDWSWRTLFNKDWEQVVFSCTAVNNDGSCHNGASDFRKAKFAIWIGYDF
jgi:outer membrane protein assembly factor BamA